MAVLFAIVLTCTDLLDCTFFADQVIFTLCLIHLKITFAVGQPSIEWLTTLFTLVKGAFGQQVLLWLVEKLATSLSDRTHTDFTFSLDFLAKSFYLLLKLQKLAQISFKLRNVAHISDRCFTGRA